MATPHRQEARAISIDSAQKVADRGSVGLHRSQRQPQELQPRDSRNSVERGELKTIFFSARR